MNHINQSMMRKMADYMKNTKNWLRKKKISSLAEDLVSTNITIWMR